MNSRYHGAEKRKNGGMGGRCKSYNSPKPDSLASKRAFFETLLNPVPLDNS
jgi:hypothetical protein